MNIIQLPLGEVHPYKNNPRKNDGAVAAVAESIKQYGFLVPLVISADHEIITGHTLTLTDNMTILELIEILQGGTLTKDEDGTITGYTPPVTGSEYKPVKFTLDAYCSQLDEGGNVLQYEKTTYPGCSGQPVALSSEDNVFRVHEYTINSAPSKGEAPYTLSYVEALPTVGTDVGV